MRRDAYLALGCCAALLGACAPDYNEVAIKIGAPPAQALNLRSLEVHRYNDVTDIALMGAITSSMQDLGFTIGEASSETGVVAAVKKRDAVETGQVAGQVVLTVALAFLGAYHNPTWDKSQEIHVTVVCSPVGSTRAIDVRVSFDRYLTNNHDQMWRTELVTEQKIYTEFFTRLDAALQLERHA